MYYREMEQYDKDLEAYGIAKSAAGKKGAGEIPPKPKKPIMLRFTTVDVTVEKLAVLLHENPRGIVVIRDELSGWVQSMNQYKGGKGADQSFWLSAWAGASHTVDRQGKDPIFVDHPAVSVVGNIPTAILGKLNMDSQDDGFLHRILFCNPDPVKVRWSDKSVADETLTAYHDSIEQLSKLELNIIGDEDDTERSEPVLMPLTAEAQQLFKLWHDAHYARSEEDTFNDGLSGFYHKLKGYCARFALIHQLLVNPKAETIGKASVGFGCDVADFFAGQAEKVFPELMQVSDSFEMKCEINIINSLRKHSRMTKRDLQGNGNAPARIFNSVLLELKEAGVVQEEGKFLTLADD